MLASKIHLRCSKGSVILGFLAKCHPSQMGFIVSCIDSRLSFLVSYSGFIDIAIVVDDLAFASNNPSIFPNWNLNNQLGLKLRYLDIWVRLLTQILSEVKKEYLWTERNTPKSSCPELACRQQSPLTHHSPAPLTFHERLKIGSTAYSWSCRLSINSWWFPVSVRLYSSILSILSFRSCSPPSCTHTQASSPNQTAAEIYGWLTIPWNTLPAPRLLYTKQSACICWRWLEWLFKFAYIYYWLHNHHQRCTHSLEKQTANFIC